MLQDGEKGVIIQRDQQTYAIAPHIPCGIISPEMLRRIADVAEKYQALALKLTAAERIAIIGLKEEDIDNVWQDLKMEPGFAIGVCIRSVRACLGITFCKKGIQDSLSMGMAMDKAYHGMQLPGKMKIGISGCPNNCADSVVRDIGLQGREDGWRIYVGGSAGLKPRIGQVLIESLDDERAKEVISRVVMVFKSHALPHERIGKLIDRIDFDEFKNLVMK